MTTDMLSWLRQQIETRKALAEAAPHDEPWVADTESEGAGIWEADLARPERCSEHEHGKVNLCDDRLLLTVDDFYADHKATLAHIVFNNPRQIIADCEADLAILDLHEIANVSVYEQQYAGEKGQPFGCRLCHEHDGITVGWGICETLRILATRYCHRPGYLPEWAPEGATS